MGGLLAFATLTACLRSPLHGQQMPAVVDTAHTAACDSTCSAVLSQEEPPAWIRHAVLGFGIQEENDAFAESDSSYTQGIRLTWMLRLPPFTDNWNFVSSCSSTLSRRDWEDRPCAMLGLSVGQSMYTPGNLQDPRVQPTSRPYGGWLYAAPSLHVISRTRALPRPVDLYVGLEGAIGKVGPDSYAQEFQSLAHWTWASGAVRPRGWSNQLRDAWVANGVLRVKARALEGCFAEGGWIAPCRLAEDIRWFDITPRAHVAAGEAMRYASRGAAVRFGWNVSDDFGVDVIPVARNPRGRADEPGCFRNVPALSRWTRSSASRLACSFRLGGVWSWDRRHVWYNRFVEGGAEDRDGGWADVRQIQLVDAVPENSWGFFVGAGTYSLTFQRVLRGREFTSPEAESEGRFAFVNLTLSRTLGQ